MKNGEMGREWTENLTIHTIHATMIHNSIKIILDSYGGIQ